MRAADGSRAAPFGFTRIVFLSHVITAGGPTFAAGQAAADELDPGDFFYPAAMLDVRAEAKECHLSR